MRALNTTWTNVSLPWGRLALMSSLCLPNRSSTACVIGSWRSPLSQQAATVASALGIRFPVLNASTEHDLDECFASLGKIGADALIVPAEPFFDSLRDRIVALAARYAVPMIAGLHEYVTAGGLMSYGPSLTDSYRRAGIYVGRVLKGEKPADLPVMQPTKFDLVLSLKTAKALGLTVPDRLLALADEVIE